MIKSLNIIILNVLITLVSTNQIKSNNIPCNNDVINKGTIKHDDKDNKLKDQRIEDFNTENVKNTENKVIQGTDALDFFSDDMDDLPEPEHKEVNYWVGKMQKLGAYFLCSCIDLEEKIESAYFKLHKLIKFIHYNSI